MEKFKKIVLFLEIISMVVTITGIGFIGIWQPIKDKIPFIHKNELLKAAESLRTTQSKDYVETILGIPQSTSKIKYKSNELVKNIYTDKYRTIICFYKEDSLVSFVVIGNKKNFNYTDYRTGSSLFETSLDTAGKNSEGYLDMVNQMVGDRMDCNRYFAVSYIQHLYGDDQIVGFGICDIGYWDNQNEKIFNNATCIASYELNNEQTLNSNERLELDGISDILKEKYNTFFTSSLDSGFVKEYILNECFLAINKGDFYNLSY